MEELKKLFEQGGMKYYYYRHGLCIMGKVHNIKTDSGLEIYFEGGMVIVRENEDIRKVIKPPIVIENDCEYCYQLFNDYRDPIGYVYKLSS